MDIFSSILLLSFSSFLYFLGWHKEDFFLELAGCIAYILTGVLIFSTGLQLVSIISTVDWAKFNNFTSWPTSDPTIFGISMQTIPASNVVGIIIGVLGCILLLYGIRTMSIMKNSINSG